MKKIVEALKELKIKNFIIEKHRDKKENIIKYLQQEIDFSKNNYAFVDINGSGRTQDILSDIISEFSSSVLATYYFCMDTKAIERKNSIKKVFICSANYNNIYLELLCRNLDGQTLEYISEDNKVRPVLEKINSKNLISWGYED